MSTVKAWGATSATKLEPITIQRRLPDDNDITIDIKYAGVCHSDIHTVRGEWGKIPYPIVVGHEIAGIISSIGKNVTKFKIGDRAGVGCMVNSCRTCDNCKDGEEQYCDEGATLTYATPDRKGGEITMGGYSERIVVDQDFVLRIPEAIPLEVAAPLLCAGITCYSPLRHWNVGPGKKVGVIGLGGLGHMALKIAKAMGAEVTVFSQTLNKKDLGVKLGADAYVASSDPQTFNQLKNKLDVIINTVSANIDLVDYLKTLRRDGTIVEVGLPENPMAVSAMVLCGGRKSISGSNIGGVRETQEMLDFCAEKGIFPECETIPASYVNEAFERVVKSQVQFRFVIDISTI